MTAELSLRSRVGRWVVATCVLGSGLAGIDATVVSIALPSLGRDLHVGFAALQWTVTAYTVTLGALTLLGGALGDRFGRRRVFVVGVVWFAVASLLCAAAPTAPLLVTARALQGVGAALLTPTSLAVLEASFVSRDRSAAIGAWSGFSGTTSALAPFVGGWLLQTGSWRSVFLFNPLIAGVVVVIALRHVPESRDAAAGRVDVTGAVLGVVGLAGVTAASIALSGATLSDASVWSPGTAGVVALVAFLTVERRTRHPLVPFSLFRTRQFAAANAVTVLLYAANGGALFLLVVALQVVCGFTPLVAGTALLPVTVVMLALAARFGRFAERYGPRRFMPVGPVLAAGGIAMLTGLDSHSDYLTGVLPAMTVFGFGLAVFVAPLTSTVLSAVPAANAGVASWINTAAARVAGLAAVAVLPVVARVPQDAAADPAGFLGPFRSAMWISAGLLAAGGLLAGLAVRDHLVRRDVATYPAACSPPLAQPVAPSSTWVDEVAQLVAGGDAELGEDPVQM